MRARKRRSAPMVLPSLRKLLWHPQQLRSQQHWLHHSSRGRFQFRLVAIVPLVCCSLPEVQIAERMSGKRKRRFTGIQFGVIASFVNETRLYPKRIQVEFDRRGNVTDIDIMV